MSGSPLVSIIMPTYERARFIGDALASIRDQHDEALEIVVVDDGSTDDTEAIVRATEPAAVYVAVEHRGVSTARNYGLRTARGELIAFLDSDDRWPAGSLAVRRAALAAKPELDLVYGQTMLRNSGRIRRKFGPYDPDSAMPLWILGSMLCRREVFDRVGLFDESLAHAEDVDWWARAKDARIAYETLADVTLEYHIHDANMTLDVERNQRFLLRALKQNLDRRRG